MAILKETEVTRRRLEEELVRKVGEEYADAVLGKVEGMLVDFEKTKMNKIVQLLRSEFLELLRRHEHMLRDLVRRQETIEALQNSMTR